jgi:hypothetical protein
MPDGEPPQIASPKTSDFPERKQPPAFTSGRADGQYRCAGRYEALKRVRVSPSISIGELTTIRHNRRLANELGCPRMTEDERR